MSNPIDIVYLWCDSSNEEWNSLRLETAKKYNVKIKNPASSECRYRSHDELKYSLRSLDKYAPWVRNIFIVVDDCTLLPSWLDIRHDRIRVVRMSEIIPKEFLPSFSSVTIEYHLHNIPTLSEHFLYANDDMLFFNPITPDFFFDEKGRPIVRMLNDELPFFSMDYYTKSLLKSYQLVMKYHPHLTKETKLLMQHFPHHNIDAYCKSHFSRTVDKYSDFLEPRFKYPFRTKEDYQRMLILWEEIAEYEAPIHLISYNSPWSDDSTVISGRLRNRGLQSLLASRAKLICFNDTQDSTEDDYAWLPLALDVLFPTPSQFEVLDY